MIKTVLTPFPGVHSRPDCRTYQFGLRVPRDLLPQFSSPWAVRCSLGTADLREANDKAKAMQAEWATRFESMRSGKPAPFGAAALRAKLLARVEEFLEAVDRRTAGMGSADREERATGVAWQLEEARALHADGRVPDWAEDWINKSAPVRSRLTDAETMPYLILCLELYHESLTDLSRAFPLRVARLNARRALAAVDGSASVTASPSSAKLIKDKGCRISDALAEWSKVPRLPKTVGVFTRATLIKVRVPG